jgi:Lrp/AsnC family leucine-responsive transcriptional regulator
MERDGVIQGYRAVVDRDAVGLHVRAYCGILRSPDVPWDQVTEALGAVDGVVSVLVVTGEADLLVEILARDMRHYAEVVLQRILSIPGVTASRSSFVLSEMKSSY